MITLSEFAVLGIIEAFAAMAIGALALIIYNHKLHKRGKSLTTQLRQLKETTVFLLEKVNSATHDSYETQISARMQETEAYLETLNQKDRICIEPDQPPEVTVTVLRYLFLEAEREAELLDTPDTRWSLIHTRLKTIVDTLKSLNTNEDSAGNEEFNTKWGYLCDAAHNLVTERTHQAEQDLVNLMRQIHLDLGLGELEIPDQPENTGATREKVMTIRESADEQNTVITELLAQRDAAKTEVNIKVGELESLQKFLAESEQCINQLEDELETAQKLIPIVSVPYNSGPEEQPSMAQIVSKFEQESQELLSCIQTLEKENKLLKQSIGD